MKTETYETFRSSLLRCLSNLDFLERFYSAFINSSPEVAQAFSNTNMERQKAMLSASLNHMMNFYGNNDEKAKKYIQQLGAQHGIYGHKVPLHLYDLWLESLITAVRESDPQFNPTLEAIWREAMTQGIDIIKGSSHLYPPNYAKTQISKGAPAALQAELQQLLESYNQHAKEAAHRSDFERDTEVTAFQFGQYRAYLHVYESLKDVLVKYSEEPQSALNQ